MPHPLDLLHPCSKAYMEEINISLHYKRRTIKVTLLLQVMFYFPESLSLSGADKIKVGRKTDQNNPIILKKNNQEINLL